MMIANRLVVFLVILLTNYACQNLAPTVKEKTERDDTGGFPLRDHCGRLLVQWVKLLSFTSKSFRLWQSSGHQLGKCCHHRLDRGGLVFTDRSCKKAFLDD